MADYTRAYTGDDGLSHFEDLDFDYGDLSGAQTPAAQGVEAANLWWVLPFLKLIQSRHNDAKFELGSSPLSN